VIRELQAGETRLAFEAMRELRPNLESEEAFVRQVDEVQRAEGYRLAGCFEEGREQAVAAIGFREMTILAFGRHVYVDDLSTHPERRRRGHARALLDWVLEEARRLGCGQLHLDSGVGLDRAAAHRLYMNAGMVIAAHHFARPVD
jgi:GNAT superfamily N-acetyltransferase